MIYLDNAATTKPLQKLSELAMVHIQEEWFNPSALYPPAVNAERNLNAAREVLMRPINAPSVYFTSGGTEGANAVILGGWSGGRQRHFVTSEYEHPCVYEAFKRLEQLGHSVDYVRPRTDGVIHAQDIPIREDTALVSIMHVNNETGAINDIPSIVSYVKQKNTSIIVHSDGVQGYLKSPLTMGQLDYYTVSAHKLHGFKGTGAIFMQKKVPFKPYIMGGGQEMGFRSGTENTLGIEAFAYAVENYSTHDLQNITAVRNRLEQHLSSIDGYVKISPSDGIANILCLSFPGMRGEVLLHLLEEKQIYISTGSACFSKKKGVSRIHSALGLSPQVSEGVIRISVSSNNTIDEADIVAEEVSNALKKFRGYFRK